MDPLILILIFLSVLILALFLPIKGARSYKYIPPDKRFHEADAVLSRRLLVPGTDLYESYYSANPEQKKADDKAREAPGLLSEGAKYHDRATFAASRANFQIIDFLGTLTHGHGSEAETPEKKNNAANAAPNPVKNARFISHWMLNTGAHSIGFTKLQDYHLYSYKGRGANAGKVIEKNHEHVIAITVEMDHDMMLAAPQGSSVMESSEQYLRSGVLALKLAAYIRDMGYEATAHIDGNYELICPLVAVDAGLGVIGRMGLLMTPDLGPRVRISAVSTTMPLIQSPGKPDRTTLHFCEMCKKCADNCPVAAIPDGPRTKTDGIDRWQISSEKCYHFWTVSGTDCGRCMTVCPYSHPDNCFHRFIRWGIKNNLLFRYLAVKLDDIIYGRKPPIRPLPDWTHIND